MRIFALSPKAFFAFLLSFASLSNSLWATTCAWQPVDQGFSPKRLTFEGPEFDLPSSTSVVPLPSLEDDPVWQSWDDEENQNPNVSLMGHADGKDEAPDPDPLSYLRRMLNQTQIAGINANVHNMDFLKKSTLVVILTRIGRDGAELLTQEEQDLVVFCGSSVEELQDMWNVERTVDVSFSSPQKSMAGSRVPLATPVARRVMCRRDIKKLTGLRSRADMEKTRQAYYQRLEEYLALKLQENARLQADAVAGAANCGLTRAGVQEEAAFLRQGLTGEMVRTFAAWVKKQGMSKGLRDEMTSHFLGKLTTYLVQFHHDNPDRLQFFFNPADINLSLTDELGRTNLQRLQVGLNPLGFELHHLTQRQNPGDVIWYLPAEDHDVEGLHAFNEYGSHMDELERARFNRIRTNANIAMYHYAVLYHHLFAR